MLELMAVLNAATVLVPAVANTVAAVSNALDPNEPAPVQVADVKRFTDALNAAAETVPVLAPVVPLVPKALNGEPFTDDDLHVLRSTADALDGQIKAAAAAAAAPAGG